VFAVAVALVVVSALAVPAPDCAGLSAPVHGHVIAGFAPIGRYAGHWGIDLASPLGSAARAAGAGRVTFAGAVAGRLSVTIDHGGGLKTSLSYLERIDVDVGTLVRAGDVVARTGVAHSADAVHFSVRLHGAYHDPLDWLGCADSPHRGLRLAPPLSSPPILPAMQRGILGGTFDPPHLAHLFAGEAAYRDLDLDVVTFMPAGAPWQKAGRQVSSAEHRWEMTRLAVAGIEYFAADDREIRRDGFTYTADTLESFPADEALTFIVGADAARNISTWQRASEVLGRARIAVVPRPGVQRSAVDWVLRGANYVWLETPEVWLSGTMLRERASRGSSLRFLVSDAVWNYIAENDLYTESAGV